MVNVNRVPHGSILINHLIVVEDPFDMERAFPSWSQFAGTLRRSCHSINQAVFLIWVDNSWRRWGSHLLVGQFQPLSQDFYIVGGIINGGRGMHIVLNIRKEGRLSTCRYHRSRKSVGLMGHCVEGKHNAWDLLNPGLG